VLRHYNPARYRRSYDAKSSGIYPKTVTKTCTTRDMNRRKYKIIKVDQKWNVLKRTGKKL